MLLGRDARGAVTHQPLLGRTFAYTETVSGESKQR